MSPQQKSFPSREFSSAMEDRNVHESTQSSMLDKEHRQPAEVISRIRDQAKDFAQNASDRASDLYKDTSSWVQENYRKPGFIMGAVGLLALIGVGGYLIWRGSREVDIYDVT